MLSLEWKEEPLDDEEIEYLIEKEPGQGFRVRFDFYPKTSIFSMNFRTYEEAHEFVTLEYKKIAFRIKVKIIDNLCQELSVSLINIACSYYRFLLYAASYRSHQLLSQCLRLTLVCLYDLHKDKIKTCTEV